jgi:hypothetical protein
MHERKTDRDWLDRVDAFLSQSSWDLTWGRMAELEMLGAIEDVSHRVLSTPSGAS